MRYLKHFESDNTEEYLKEYGITPEDIRKMEAWGMNPYDLKTREFWAKNKVANNG